MKAFTFMIIRNIGEEVGGFESKIFKNFHTAGTVIALLN